MIDESSVIDSSVSSAFHEAHSPNLIPNQLWILIYKPILISV